MNAMTEPSSETLSRPNTSEREAALEDRIRKLESALAERPVASSDEDAMTDRVIAKLSALAGSGRSAADRVLVLASDDSRYPVPPLPQGAVINPPTQPIDPSQRRWFFTQFWSEIQLAFRMYFDPHYRVSRTTQFAIPGIALLLVFDYFFFSWVSIAFVSPIVERLLAVCLGVLGYKLIVRELGRYRDVLEYLARYGPR
ncbi:MAG: hypothetical protein C0467_12110 [Planctomycetaceae bacterium]|nr:hypothetical protein [Planctomycetaceae bacterium]